MAEGMDEEQLVDFCHQLGLAKDGYLNENDLSVVCRCIGLIAPEEMMKQLFEELDGDNDGKVCLAELSLMLRGMQLQSKKTSTSFSDKKLDNMGSGNENTLEFSPIGATEHCVFSILDPEHKGFAKVGVIIDLWSTLGISPDVGLQILKELGFSTHSKLNSINLQDLGRSMDDETDHSKEVGLPPIFHAALLTYRTEAQYLRSLCEAMECERDKLKSDILEAHQRSTMIAQEVDEQNSRLERSSQLHLLKIESKYTEQIQTLQRNVTLEKESLQQTIQLLESQLNALHDDETKLKVQISKLKLENTQLESEVKNLTQEVNMVTRLKEKLQAEMSRCIELEKRLEDMERQSNEKVRNNEVKLQNGLTEIQSLKDQNDELSSQLEKMKDTMSGIKTVQGKRFYIRRRRKKVVGLGPGEKLCDPKLEEDCHFVPLEKIGKFHQDIASGIENIMFQAEHDAEDAESSLEHVFLSCSSQEPDSGTFKNNAAINLDGCVMDHTCTESHTSIPEMQDQSESMVVAESFCGDNELQTAEKLDEEFRTLQRQMETVQNKIKCILSERDTYENENLRDKLEAVVRANSDHNGSRIFELEKLLEETKFTVENEKKELQMQCSNLENSLDLLQSEYEKCEEYWHGKLQEERIDYEHDRNVNDEKFYELSLKIKEYEEMFLLQQQNEYSSKLPPIEERASLEKQVTDLDDECNCLREQLNSLQMEQQSVLTNYQRSYELKAREECACLEQQVKALQVKCQEYEIRITAITEEERKDDETHLTTMLKSRITALENQLQNQQLMHAEHVQHLNQTWKQKNFEKSSQEKIALTPNFTQSTSNYTHRADLLELLQAPQAEQFCVQTTQMNFHPADKTSSLPFIPVTNSQNLNSGQWMPWGNFESWNPSTINPSQQSKKAWCHVEVGWLQALRTKLKQREDQCLMLQRALCSLEQQHEKILAEIKYKHDTETSNWESLMHASQEIVRQQTLRQKDQADKLLHAESIVKDLWVEKNKLLTAFSAAQERVAFLESSLQKSSNSSILPSNGIPTIPIPTTRDRNNASIIPSTSISIQSTFSNSTTYNSFSR